MATPKLKLTIGGKTVEITAKEARELRKQLEEFDDSQTANEIARLTQEIARLRASQTPRPIREREPRMPHPDPFEHWPRGFPPIICKREDAPHPAIWEIPRHQIGDFPHLDPVITCHVGN